MWPQTQSFHLLLLVLITGCLSVSWEMKVSPVVSVPRGGTAVLSCSFTHPRQQDYSGMIAVKWLVRETNALPFFSCLVKNDSSEGLSGCSYPGLRYSLEGDPRRGELSLLIRTVHLTDNGTYFCRVELDGWGNYYQKQTQLYVTVKPEILSLSVVEKSSGSHSATQRLQCEAEGNPLPTITWLSASRSPLKDQVQTSGVYPYRVVSSVPCLEGDVLTCRVESRLGVSERRYPASKTLMITLTVCGLVVMLLLLTGFIYYTRIRARAESPPLHENADKARADTSPIYENAEMVENHQLQGCASPAEDAAELQLVYSSVTLTSQHAGLKSSTRQQEADVLYSPVNVQY